MKLNRIETILATGIYLFILVLIFGNQDWETHSTASPVGYTTVIYGAFLAFTQWVSPVFFRERKIEPGIAFTLLLFFLVWLGLTVCIWMRDYHWNNGQFVVHLKRGESLGGALLVLSLLFAYEGIKRLVRYLQQTKNILAIRIAKESLVVLGGGMVVFFLLLAIGLSLANDETLALLWLSAVPYNYLIFALNVYWLLPLKDKRGYTFALYLLFSLGLSFIAFVPFGSFFLFATGLAGPLYFVLWVCANIIMLPLANFVYQRQKERIGQLVNLQTELGQTSAGLSFLRSQINPHFLFNILNTLYGTALQEDAERTASGIQKLGDMMRFMLHENNQERILLAREIEYLRNYIDLQLLRTATSPEITVECDIKDALEGTYIAPMLLIPFVENAFKHGISLNEKSWIKVSLYESEGELYFDVHNSIHRKPESDPERRHSGVGLENVKQRLAMLYLNRHELVIRGTTQEYFVHLTVQL